MPCGSDNARAREREREAARVRRHSSQELRGARAGAGHEGWGSPSRCMWHASASAGRGADLGLTVVAVDVAQVRDHRLRVVHICHVHLVHRLLDRRGRGLIEQSLQRRALLGGVLRRLLETRLRGRDQSGTARSEWAARAQSCWQAAGAAPRAQSCGRDSRGERTLPATAPLRAFLLEMSPSAARARVAPAGPSLKTICAGRWKLKSSVCKRV